MGGCSYTKAPLPIILDTTILFAGWWRMWEAVPILEPPHLEHLFSLSLPLMGEGGSDQRLPHCHRTCMQWMEYSITDFPQRGSLMENLISFTQLLAHTLCDGSDKRNSACRRSLDMCRQQHQDYKKNQVSCVRCNMSCVTCHMSCVMCHMLRVTCHMSLTSTATAMDPPPVNSHTMHSRMVCKDP